MAFQLPNYLGITKGYLSFTLAVTIVTAFFIVIYNMRQISLIFTRVQILNIIKLFNNSL